MKTNRSFGSKNGVNSQPFNFARIQGDLTEAYQLRDALRKKYIRRAEQGKTFPRRAQHLLDSIERVIASQERAQVLRAGKTRSAARNRITS